MHNRRAGGALRIRCLTIVLGVVTAGLSVPALMSGVAAADLDSVRLEITGDVSTVPTERPGAPHEVEQAVVLADGTAVPVESPDLPVDGKVTATLVLDSDEAPDRVAGRLSTESSDGLRLAQRLAATGTTYRLEDVEVAPERVAPTPSAHRAYIAIVNNVGAYQGLSQADLVDRVETATDFWTEQSDGAVPAFTTAGTVSFSSPTAASAPGCGLGGSTSDFRAVTAEAAALFPGVDFDTAPNHLLVLLPDECPVSFAVGLGELGTSIGNGGAVLAHIELSEGVSTMAHEIGHNLSLMHSGATTCSPYNPDSCRTGEYDDMYTVMGYANDSSVLPALNSVQRRDLDLLGSDASRVVSLSDSQSSVTTTARIVPRTSSTGQRTLAVVDPESERTYYLDYRAGTGRDAGALYTTGYQTFDLHFGTGLTISSTTRDRSSTLWPRAVDSDDHRAAWQVGETFVNRTGSVSVEVEAIQPGQHVDVTVTVASELAPFTDPPTPVVTGDAEVGETLNLDVGEWPEGTFLEWRWLVDGYPWTDPFEGSNAYSFYLQPWHRGQRIQVEVVARHESRRTRTLLSNVVGPVTRPVRAYVDILSNPPLVGQVVNTSITLEPSNAQRTYQWLAGGQPISGATGTTYAPVAADVGKTLALRVTASAAGYDPTTFVSDESSPVPARPTISGTPRIGSTLTAQTTGWPGTGFTYQWLRDGAVMTGATARTYQPVAADAGRQVSVWVTETGDYAVQAADPVTIEAGTLTTAVPTFAAPRVGGRVTVSPGAWTSGTAFTYLWLRDGAAIAGATSASYTPVAGDLGRQLAVRVTGTKAGYASATSTSAASPVGPGQLTAPKPRISGTAKVGKKLKAAPGAWTSGTALTYQWLANGKAIKRATKATYTIVRSVKGKKVSVRITGKRLGYTTRSVTSASTGKVR